MSSASVLGGGDKPALFKACVVKCTRHQKGWMVTGYKVVSRGHQGEVTKTWYCGSSRRNTMMSTLATTARQQDYCSLELLGSFRTVLWCSIQEY